MLIQELAASVPFPHLMEVAFYDFIKREGLMMSHYAAPVHGELSPSMKAM